MSASASRHAIFQSTLPHGSDPAPASTTTVIIISIHAPSRERLPWSVISFPLIGISIHAPSRERLCTLIRFGSMYPFQSTLPRGSDHQFCKLLIRCRHFNPRSLAGATYGRHAFGFLMSLFQSTLPRGSDLASYRNMPLINYFNPRSLAGATRQSRLQGV